MNASESQPRAVLVGVQLHGIDDAEHASSLEELGRLAHTLGYAVVGTVTQRRAGLAPAAVLGHGKLRALAELTGGTGVIPSGATRKVRKIDAADDEDGAMDEVTDDVDESDNDDTPVATQIGDGRPAGVVLVDHELSPSQARNLERATGASVMDRTAVILEIFHRHARSREAKLQVEIARLNYLAPRLRETGGGDRQRGGVGNKGAGESSLELDRRKIRDRVSELRHELAAVSRDQGNRRTRRHEALRVALVGYTNAGKSSLMRALTGSEVYVADKLFATLDTTVRALYPESHPRVLVSDTVGFIKKLPHDLVASFRSTLDEAREAGLLVHVVDGSDAAFRAQLAVTRSVLAEIGAGDIPSVLVLNKSDRLHASAQELLALEYPDGMVLSARSPDDVARLRAQIVAFFERGTIETELTVPYGRKGAIAEIHRECKVLSETYDTLGGTFCVRAAPETIARLRGLLSDGDDNAIKND